MGSPIQIPDDLALLDLMMNEMSKASAGFRATPYWEYYQSGTLEILRTNGLRDLRQISNPEITSFGCYEGALFGSASSLREMGLSEPDIDAIGGFVQVLQKYPSLPILPMGRSITDIIRLELRVLEMEAKLISPNAVSIFDLDCSLAGNPLGKFRVDGNWYTQQLVSKYQVYLDCFRVFDLAEVDTVVEIGSGMGQQVEILRKLHPHLSFVLVDIPPQLYVAHQYLKTVFGDDVVDYRETNRGSLGELESGKLYFLGPWMLPSFETRGRTLLWNARSFQEMSEETVKGYYEIFRGFAHELFLMNRTKGFSKKFREDLQVSDIVDFDFYKNLFGEHYEFIDVPEWENLNNPTSYRPMAWRQAGL
jgi:putative sugar O-methyltransferase